MRGGKTPFVWLALTIIVLVPVFAAASSPLLAWRQPIYILAGFAGVLSLAALLLQPLLIGRLLPGLRPASARRLHRGVGGLLVCGIAVHVGGLWITSPPDVLDALVFASPTPFSAWGVVAMWAAFAAAMLALLRSRGRFSPRLFRRLHAALAVVVVAGGVVHALQIEGTMEPVSKVILCGAVVLATLAMIRRLRPWRA